MGRGGAIATSSNPSDAENCGFSDDSLSTKFFGAVSVLVLVLCFGAIEYTHGGGQMPSSTQCTTDPQFSDYPGNDLVPGGMALVNNLDCCQKCSEMVGAVQWVYHTPMAIGGTNMCYCKSKLGVGSSNQQYVAVKIANPASSPWGGAFIMVLAGAALLYLVGGVVINFQRGLRDLDMIPNGSMWSAIPALVIDGVGFVASGGAGGAGYQAIERAGTPSSAAGSSGAEDVESPSMLPDIDGLGNAIMERDEAERKARKKAAKKDKKKRGSVPSLTDETEREEARRKLKEKDKRSRRKSHAAQSPKSGGDSYRSEYSSGTGD